MGKWRQGHPVRPSCVTLQGHAPPPAVGTRSSPALVRSSEQWVLAQGWGESATCQEGTRRALGQGGRLGTHHGGGLQARVDAPLQLASLLRRLAPTASSQLRAQQTQACPHRPGGMGWWVQGRCRPGRPSLVPLLSL